MKALAGASLIPARRSTSWRVQSSPTFLHHIFEARVFPIRAITKIPMNREHRLGHRFEVLRREKIQNRSQSRIGFRIAVAHAHAATGEKIVASKLATLLDRDKPEVVRKISMSFSGGMTNATLNLRGRYVLP